MSSSGIPILIDMLPAQQANEDVGKSLQQMKGMLNGDGGESDPPMQNGNQDIVENGPCPPINTLWEASLLEACSL